MAIEIAYQERYAPGSRPISADRLPSVAHVAPSLIVEAAEVTGSGRVYIDDQGRLFQDIRVYLVRNNNEVAA